MSDRNESVACDILFWLSKENDFGVSSDSLKEFKAFLHRRRLSWKQEIEKWLEK